MSKLIGGSVSTKLLLSFVCLGVLASGQLNCAAASAAASAPALASAAAKEQPGSTAMVAAAVVASAASAVNVSLTQAKENAAKKWKVEQWQEDGVKRGGCVAQVSYFNQRDPISFLFEQFPLFTNTKLYVLKALNTREYSDLRHYGLSSIKAGKHEVFPADTLGCFEDLRPYASDGNLVVLTYSPYPYAKLPKEWQENWKKKPAAPTTDEAAAAIMRMNLNQQSAASATSASASATAASGSVTSVASTTGN